MPRRASTQVKEKNSCRWWEHTWTASVCRTDATFSELLSWSESVPLRPLEPAGTSRPSDRQLGGQLEIFRPMGERPTHPRLEGGLVVGDEAASRQPAAIEPLQGAEFEVQPAADRNFRHAHRRKLIATHFAARVEACCLHGDIVLAVLQRRDLGIVPLVTEPLAIGEPASFGPGQESKDRLHGAVALVGPVHPNVGYGTRRELADAYPKGVRVVPGWQMLEVRAGAGLFDDRL